MLTNEQKINLLKNIPLMTKEFEKKYFNKTDIEVKEFTEEIIKSDLIFVADRRVDCLNSQIVKIYRKIAWWLDKYTSDKNWNEAIAEIIKQMARQIEKLEKEIYLYRNPTAINYESKITDQDVEDARRVDCSLLIETQTRTGKDWAVCPFHHDTNPSMLCYPEGRGFYCFACNTGGNAIDLTMKLYNLDFQEAVKKLKG